MKNILYFIPRYDASAMGNTIHTEVLARWRERGVASEVLTLAAGAPAYRQETIDGVTIHRLPVSAGWPLKFANRALNLVFHYPYLAGAAQTLRSFLAQRRYDLMHIETAFPLGFVASLVPPRGRPPLAITLPGADLMSEPEFDYGYGRFAAVRATFGRVFDAASVVRADSLQIADLAARLGADRDQMRAIPYNITEDSYPPRGADLAAIRQRSRAEVVERHGLNPARPIVVSLNRLHPFKGIAYLVEALPHLRAAGLNPQVLIVGPNRSTSRFGDYGAYMASRAASLGVADAVTFTGGVPHTQTFGYLAAADAVVVASVAESFSRVVIEAAAAGTPPVVTRTTGASDYVVQADCGVVVEPRSAESLGTALAALLRDADRWQTLSERCPPFAEQFRSQRIADDLLDLYAPWL